MKILQTILLITAVIAVVACSTKKPTDKTIQNRETLIKNYAFCRCMYYSLPNDSSIHTDPSGAVLRELLAGSDELSSAVDSIARGAAEAILPSVIHDHGGRRLVLYECFKFYGSAKLDSVAKKYAAKETRTF